MVRANAVLALAAACALGLAGANTLAHPGGLLHALDALPLIGAPVSSSSMSRHTVVPYLQDSEAAKPLGSESGLAVSLLRGLLPAAWAEWSLAQTGVQHGAVGARADYRKVERLQVSPGHRVEQAMLLFDVLGDFTALFDWNTKQLFFYVVVEWETNPPSAPRGQALPKVKHSVVIWDHIVESPEEAVLSFRHLRNKYALIDPEGGLRGASATLSLRWDVTPIVGWIRRFQAETQAHFDFPKSYVVPPQS
jgi:Signal peptidase subunit